MLKFRAPRLSLKGTSVQDELAPLGYFGRYLSKIHLRHEGLRPVSTLA
jgi:hypothetical protein